MEYVFPKYTTGEKISEMRKHLNMSQREFAEFSGVSKPTVERWEASGDKHISGPIVPFIELLKRDRDIPETYSVPEERLKLRLFYMWEDSVCTIIDVDEPERKVRIKNYFKNPMYLAFGVNEHPSFEDYTEFLKSRCFPEERDKIKLELKKLDIPFYDPLLIIEKTKGRMANDKFWLRVER